MGKEENSLLNTIISKVFLICPTLSPSYGGASPIRHPRGPPQSFRATKNTTELSKFGLLILFTGNVGNRPLKTIKYKVSLICHTPSPLWVSSSPICHPNGHPQSAKATKNTIKMTIWLTRFFAWVIRGTAPLRLSNIRLSDKSYPVIILGWQTTHLSPQGHPSELQGNKKQH